MSKIKHVIFDMDGVIIDSEVLHKDVETKLLKEIGINITHKELEAFAGNSMYRVFKTILDSHNMSYDIDKLIEQKDIELIKLFDEKLELVNGVFELINHLYNSNITLSIASSSSLSVINFVLKRFSLNDKFKFVTSGQEVADSKPNPDIFLLALERSGFKKSESLIIEDSTAGVKAGINAKITTIGFRNPTSGNQDLSLSNQIISNFSINNFERLLN